MRHRETDDRSPVPRATAWAVTQRHSTDIEECYAAHFHGLTIQLYAYTGDLALAHDLVQEAFCRAFPRWSKISTYDDPVAWLRRVAFNLATSRWRRARTARAYARRQREEFHPGLSPDRVALAAALATLPANHRRVVVLHHLTDLPVAQIARSEGVPERTVRVWLHRGRAALAVQLADTGRGQRHA